MSQPKTAIAGTVFFLNACVMAPPRQNYIPGQSDNQSGYGNVQNPSAASR